MYLYFPGDPIDSPFLAESQSTTTTRKNPHSAAHLKAAIDGYKWLNSSNMTGPGGLYADGFHISGYQGVILSGLRGLWLATNSQDYLVNGHELVHKVQQATDWPYISSQQWSGLGRGGVLEDACDSSGSCSQDGQTFKGIFFHHLAEFCRPLQPQEERFLADAMEGSPPTGDSWDEVYQWHMERCRAYGSWIEHNAQAALMTRDSDGKFGSWWDRPYCQLEADSIVDSSTLPVDAIDYRNFGDFEPSTSGFRPKDYNDRGRGRTVETQSGGIAVLRALYQWQSCDAL
jgi:hypothetical protein